MNQNGRIGQFEILERLGEGGIGQVYSAHDTILDRQVAIKSLRPELLNDKSFVERFLAEAKNLAHLSHPNITTLYSLLQESGNIYMIMELVRGRTLEAILHHHASSFAPQEALAIVGQAADGLAYAHEIGVVHRDVKPANLILTDKGLLKIMDFGIARVQGSQRMTRDGSVVGTLAYMSPEQCRGQDVDGRSDLYSLAIVLYELLTGKVPFSAQSDYDLMQAHINQAPEPPSRRLSGLEPHIEKALMKALSKRREDRFDNVLAFKEALGAPASRTDSMKIVHGVTRLLATPLAPLTPAATALASGVTDAVKKSRVSRALGGVVVGGAAALVLVALVFYFLRPPAAEPGPTIADISPGKTISAPPPVAAPPLANPNFLAAPPTDSRAYLPPPSEKATNSSGGVRPSPFAAAAEPNGAGSAAITADKPARSTETANDRPQAADSSAAKPAPAPSPAPEERQISAKDVTAAYDAKDYAAAREKAEACAKSGDAECEFILGKIYEHGQGGEQNSNIAADWYRKAAEAGHEKASYNLGVLYYNGEGVPKNPAAAAEWFTKAAYKHYSKAQLNLGMLYQSGDGVQKDLNLARYWYAEAAKSDDPAVAEAAQQALAQLSKRRR